MGRGIKLGGWVYTKMQLLRLQVEACPKEEAPKMDCSSTKSQAKENGMEDSQNYKVR